MCAEAVALGCAIHAAREDRQHRPVALLFAFAVVSDLASKALQVALLSGAPRPFAGLARLAFDNVTMLGAAWPLALALLAGHLFWRRRMATAAPIGAALGVAVSLALLSPLSGERTQALLLRVEGGALVWAFACAVAGWGSGWRAVHGVALFLFGTELVVVCLGPFATNIFRDWNVARVLYTVAFFGLSFWYTARPHPRHLAE